MEDKIVVIGDSHSRLFDNYSNYNVGLWSNDYLKNFFEVAWIGPVTMYRVCRDGLSVIFNNIKLVPNQHCVLSFGEIDVRSHVFKQVEDQNKTFYNIIDDLVDGLRKRLIEFNYYDYNIHILSIVPPIQAHLCIGVNEDFPFIGTDEERRNAVLYFNERLLKLSVELKIGYFDYYHLYADSDNFLNINRSDKIVHAIKTVELEEYIKEYFNL